MSDEATLAVIEKLDAESIPYILVGSYASNAYGAARRPADADFVIEPGWMTVETVEQRLLPAIRTNTEMYVEIVAGQRRLTADVIGKPFVIEFFILNDDPHSQTQFQRRKLATVLERQVWIPTVEDMIVAKLRWASKADDRSKNKIDAFNILLRQIRLGNRIDWDYVNHWCEQHGTQDLCDKIRTWSDL